MSNYIDRSQKLIKASTTRSPSERLKNLGEFQNKIFIDLADKKEDENIHGLKYRDLHLNDKYFKIEHIENMELPFDVAMILTKRGTGKTYSYMQLLEKIAAKGEQFVIVRNTKQEIDGGVMEQFFYPNCPFEVRKNKVYYIGDDKPVGYLAYLSGVAQQWQGAGYKEVSTIIGDEATNAGQTTAKTASWIRAFGQLTSTFFRNRINGKIWIFGNLMKDSSRQISDTLHKYLGIDSDLNFKYIVNTTESGHAYRLLYLNTGNLYIGADEHLMSNISLSKEIRDELKSNLPSKMGECILPDYYFTMAKNKEWGILTQYDKKEGMILIASEPYINIENKELLSKYEQDKLDNVDLYFFIIRCEPLNKANIGFEFPLFTDDANLYNMYKDVGAFVKNKDKLKRYGYKLHKIIKSGYACYVGDNSYIDLCRIMNGRKDEIQGYKDDRLNKIKKLKNKKQK